MTMTWPTSWPEQSWSGSATLTVAPEPPQATPPVMDEGKERHDAPVSLPASVWVAVVTVITELVMRAPKVNTGNRSMGMSGLFAGVTKGETVTQEHSAARVCGVAASEDEAKALLETWKARNGQVVIGDEMVVQVPFGTEADVGLEEASTRQCADCGTVISFGLRCRSCIDTFHEQLAAKDAKVLADALAEKMGGAKRSVYDEWSQRVNGQPN